MMRALPAIFSVLLIALSSCAQKALIPDQSSAWVNCVLITKTGDAVKAQLKNKKDFSALGCLLPGQEIIVRHTDGKEVITAISNISEILIPGRTNGYNHYLILSCNNICPGQFHIYRVLTEGNCKLLYTEMPGKAGNMTINISHHGETISTLNQRKTEEYYLYYNKALTMVHVDNNLNLSNNSKSDCLAVFKNCPQVVKDLNAIMQHPLKIIELIEQFNGCGRVERE